MNAIELLFCKIFRKTYQQITGQRNDFQATDTLATLQNQAAADQIARQLSENKPCLIARFGEIELDAVLTYYFMKKPKLKQYQNFITGVSHRANWSEEVLYPLNNNAGVFPKNATIAKRFADLYLTDCQEIDILGSWQSGEKILEKELQKALRVRLADLEPYYHSLPWSRVLEGKKILVIHPFDESIRKQYSKRKLLFENPQILPDFELQTLKAVQSATGLMPQKFGDWFEALEFMKTQITDSQFDIALIGCGAYGLPLGAHIKRLGKKAVHLGGAIQILFGIRGKRWDEHSFISTLYNSHWTRPMPSETPQAHQKIEAGCYW